MDVSGWEPGATYVTRSTPRMQDTVVSAQTPSIEWSDQWGRHVPAGYPEEQVTVLRRECACTEPACGHDQTVSHSTPFDPTKWAKVRVTLCGSTRFRAEFLEEARRLTLEGVIVISVGVFAHHEPGFDPDGETKAMLDRLHLAKIDMADAIHVVNPGGYVGTSTRREIAYAAEHGKGITYVREP